MIATLVTGSRKWTDRVIIERAFNRWPPQLIIHGDAPGLDTLADFVAVQRGIDRVRCPANWTRHGHRAGPIRNRFMLKLLPPARVLAFPLPGSVGTIDMIRLARRNGIDVFVYGEDFE